MDVPSSRWFAVGITSAIALGLTSRTCRPVSFSASGWRHQTSGHRTLRHALEAGASERSL